VGFLTLAMSQLNKLDHQAISSLTAHPYIPSLLIGEFARDINFRGVGRLMLDWVITKAKELSESVACRCIIIQSLESKVGRYKKLGFVPINDFEEKRNTMFIDLDWYKT
jgi:hypothetical protein